MSVPWFPVDDPAAYRRAALSDLVRLYAVPGRGSLFLAKETLEVVVRSIVAGELIHLSGPTGTAKTALVEALDLEPSNMLRLCAHLGLPERPLRVYPVHMCTFESPAEIFFRRALRDGDTVDEWSPIVRAIEDAGRVSESHYPLIFLKEMGRCHSSAVQGGLLDVLVQSGSVALPDGRVLDTGSVAWLCDSNYVAEGLHTHTLVELDAGLQRRFTRNVTLDWLSAPEEVTVLRARRQEESVDPNQGARRARDPDADSAAEPEPDPEADDPVLKAVELGQEIRSAQREGRLASAAPPTIAGYESFLRLHDQWPELGLERAAWLTLLGNVGLAERDQARQLVRRVFGLAPDETPDFEQELATI